MSLPRKRCPLCGSRNLGGWSDGFGGSGQFCNDCDWEEDHYTEPDPDDYKPVDMPNRTVEVP